MSPTYLLQEGSTFYTSSVFCFFFPVGGDDLVFTYRTFLEAEGEARCIDFVAICNLTTRCHCIPQTAPLTVTR